MKIKRIYKILITILAVFLCIAIFVNLFLPKIFQALEKPKVQMPANLDFSLDSKTAKLRANLNNPAFGFCENEADTLRENILNSKNTADLYKITGTKYYISSSDGDDKNDGLSPETAFKTIHGLDKVFTYHGDAILFKRGDIFRFGETINACNSHIYGAYGEGSKPKIYGSPENYAESDKWTKHQGNIWKIPFDYPEACGLVLNHSETVGIKKKKLSSIRKNGDYFHDTKNGTFYLYSSNGIPSSAYKDIEIMPSLTLFTCDLGNNDVIIDNLCLKYTAGFAIHVIDAKDFTVTNCEIGFVGGKWTGNHKLRYGNAIEFWTGAEDIKVENNWIYQTFDSALTWQGDTGSLYQNISFSNNLFEYNNADIEFFEDGATLSNFSMKNNIMRFTSMGWGTRRADGGIRGIEGCIRGVTGSHPANDSTTVINVYFTDNILDSPARQVINWSWEPEHKENIHTSGTKIYINSKYRKLKSLLQGLQTQKGQSYGKRSAKNFEELKSEIEVFEKGVQIVWE